MGTNDKIFTNEKTMRLLFKFAVPSIFSLLVIELYNIVDTIYVGRYIGTDAIAALTVAFPIQRLLSAVSFLMAIGTSTYVSRSLGKRDIREIKRAIINAFVMALILMTMIPFLIFIFKEPLLYKLGASSITYPMADEYISNILLGGIFQCIGLLSCYIMTSLGNTKITFYTNSIGAAGNAVIGYVLVAYYGMGVRGAAAAAVAAQIISFIFAICNFIYMTKSFKLKFTVSSIIAELNIGIIRNILGIGFSSFIIEISDAIVAVVLNILLYTRGGDAAIAIVGVVTRISMFMFITILGISSGMQPIVAYNFGAERYNKVKEALIISIKSVTIISFISAAALGLLSNHIIGIFVRDKEILSLASRALRICISILPLTGIYYIGIYYYQALGKARKGFLLSIFRQLAVFIPLAIIFVQIMGTVGAWIAYPASDFISAVLSTYLLIRISRGKDNSDIEIIDDKRVILN